MVAGVNLGARGLSVSEGKSTMADNSTTAALMPRMPTAGDAVRWLERRDKVERMMTSLKAEWVWLDRKLNAAGVFVDLTTLAGRNEDAIGWRRLSGWILLIRKPVTANDQTANHPNRAP